MLERFTGHARQIARDAEHEARLLGAPEVGSDHLLVAVAERCSPSLFAEHAPPFPPGAPPVTADRLRGLLRSEEPDAAALETIGISLADVRRRVEEAFGPEAWNDESPRRLRFSREAKRALELALREALELGVRRIGPVEVLLGLLREEGAATRLLEACGADPRALYGRLRASVGELARLAAR